MPEKFRIIGVDSSGPGTDSACQSSASSRVLEHIQTHEHAHLRSVGPRNPSVAKIISANADNPRLSSADNADMKDDNENACFWRPKQSPH